jgi:hypothetical protein
VLAVQARSTRNLEGEDQIIDDVEDETTT